LDIRVKKYIIQGYDGVAEVIEMPGHPGVIAVQWHPEQDPHGEATRRLFRSLVGMAAS
jgi:gamma-glutamyl-gamma-aminobutyrate hydrolase PuuD